MVIKVDFDLTMSILAHNRYRLLALKLDSYSHLSAQGPYEKFILNCADIDIEENTKIVNLKKKRALPLILEIMGSISQLKYPWLANKTVQFRGASYS
jgi:hypothetical protein